MGWPMISAIIGGISLLSSLFGGGNDQAAQTTTTTESPKGYQSPMLAMMDPTIAGLLTSLMKDRMGAGMPGGNSNMSAMLPNMNQLMQMIKGGLGTSLQGSGGGKPNPTSAYDTLGIA